jgi:hypothetical protein
MVHPRVTSLLTGSKPLRGSSFVRFPPIAVPMVRGLPLVSMDSEASLPDFHGQL